MHIQWWKSFLTLLFCVCIVYCRNVVENTARQKRTSENSCANVRPFFQSRNIPLNPYDSPKGNICSGLCCGPEAEAVLRKHGQEVFANMLRHNSRSWQGLLNSTATTLQEHFTDLADQSENQTSNLISKVYRRMAVHSMDAIEGLYSDIRRYVQINSSQDAFGGTNINIMSSVSRFFNDMFPLMYHKALNVSQREDFAPEYKQCLREAFSQVQPFSDIPRQVSQSLSKSLDSARLLLQAFSVGVEVLNATDTLIIEDNSKSNAECHDALMKMTYCPKCIGLRDKTKPCSGYCLNVLRGCLTKYVAELDAPWNGYVEGIERLVSAMRQPNNEVGVDVNAVIRELHNRISQAIMHAMGHEKDIDIKVKRACGIHKLSPMESLAENNISGESKARGGKTNRPSSSSSTSSSSPRQQFSTSETLMTHFLTSIAKSRGFYSTLANNLCQDESFAETKDEHCWNGERIGEYTKTVVDASLDMQRYNPELKPSVALQSTDPRVANLADKLRHVQQMVMSSLGAVGLPESDNFMQGDGAEGSGSGVGPNFGRDDDEEIVRGSGSGGGPPYTGKDPGVTEIDDNDIDHTSSPTASTTTVLPSILLVFFLIISTLNIS